MVNEEVITFEQIRQQKVRYSRIIIKRKDNKNDIYLELEEDREKKSHIAENIDAVLLYGVRTMPELGGPFFIAVIEEGILTIHEEVLYRISEEEGTKYIRIYIPIW